MSLAAGDRLGPYQVISHIGAGGMGEVYQARDTRLDRTVAIKVLLSPLATDPQVRDRFDREAKAIAALSHPNICTLFDVGREGDTDFIVMEYLDGQSLAVRLEAGALPLDEALRLAIEIAGALDKAHSTGIIHRDLKPGNVMLTRGRAASDRPVAKLLDFGLAKNSRPALAHSALSMLPTTPANLTAEGTILGTFQYMAPEQLDGLEADTRTDIFAFGALVYEMLTGQKAFAATTPAGVIGAIMRGDLPKVSALVPLVPPALDRVIGKCLAKDPDARWQTARDLRDELHWIAGAAHEPKAAGVTPPRWRYAGWIVAAAALLAAAGVAVANRSRPTSEVPLLRLELNTGPTSDLVSFALSPDGRQLAFVATSDGVSKLWMRPLDATVAQPLAGTEGAAYPFWAPDSRSVGFFADGKVKRLDLDGGRPIALTEAGTARGGAWNRDGDILFTVGLAGLLRISSRGGPVTNATELAPGEGNHRWPVFLPDGRHFLFFVSFSRPEVQGVYIGSLDSLQKRRLLASDTGAIYAPPGHLLFMRQGVLMAVPFDVESGTLSGDPVPVATNVGSDANVFRGAYTVSETGLLAYRTGGSSQRQIVSVDRAGIVDKTSSAADEHNLVFAELSPDGRRLAVTRTVDGNADIWLMDTARGVPTRLTSEEPPDDFPVWSPDSSRIIYRSTRSGASGLFERPSNAAGQTRSVFSGAAIPNAWSPDGRVILFSRSSEKMGSDIWSLAVGESTPTAIIQTPFDEDEAQFSPDGHWIAYRSNESGRPEVYVRPYPGPDNPQPVSTTGGSDPRWRRDGKELFYVSADRKLTAVPISMSSSPPRLTIGAPVPLFQTRMIAISLPKPQYSVALDGQRFWMNVTVDEVTPSIVVVQNWTAGLSLRSSSAR